MILRVTETLSDDSLIRKNVLLNVIYHNPLNASIMFLVWEIS